jgi:hypothetical protein
LFPKLIRRHLNFARPFYEFLQVFCHSATPVCPII